MWVGLGIGVNTNIGRQILTFYVRPSGSTYGDGSGASYANAWSGFTAVGSLQQNAIVDLGGRLAICGTHNQSFTISASGLTVIGNDINASGIIDGQTSRATGITIDGVSNVTISNLVVSNHTTQNIFLGNGSGTGTYTNITLNMVTFNNCTTNQGVQCWGITGVGGAGVPTATFNYCIGNGNGDEAISVHQNGNIVINGGQFQNNVNAFVNTDTTGTAKTVTINDVWDTSGNGVDLQINATATFNVNNCVVRKITTTTTGIYNFSKCYIYRSPATSTADNVNGTVKMRHCLVDFSGVSGTAQSGFDFQSGGVCDILYTNFIGIPTGKFGIMFRSGAVITNMSNYLFYGDETTKVGQAFFRASGVNVTTNNGIFVGLDTISNSVTGTFTFNNCCFYNNTNAPSGTQNNSQTGNPNFIDAANKDWRLGAGSSCIGTGATLSDAVGISNADWGDGATEVPSVTTGNQSANWNIGAFV